LKKFWIKLILFFIGLIIILNRLNTIFLLKEYPVGDNINQRISPYTLCEKQDGFYALQPNSIDVLFIGSSNIHCNINPNQIWNQYGFTSYDFCCDQQELGTSYYYLEQALKTQSPEVVVIDILNDGSQDEINVIQAHYAFDNMKDDIYKYKAIWNRAKSNRLELALPLIRYHERWNELTQNDYKYKKGKYNVLKGCFIYMVSNKQENPQVPKTISEYSLSDKTISWIEDILQVCEKNNCECLFIKTPLAGYDEGQYAYFQAFNEYCQKENVKFLDLNNYVDDIGLDFDEDYADKAHMNWNGQKKLSNYLGNFIKVQYDINDKRGNYLYDNWNEDYDEMMIYINSFYE